MKICTKKIYYFPVMAMIFVISSHLMAAANQLLTIDGYARIAGGKKAPARLHIARSADEADRMKQSDYRCCSLGVLGMEFEFPIDFSIQHHNDANSIKKSNDVVSEGFHLSDFEGPHPLTGSQKLLTISNEGGTAEKRIRARTHSWMGSGETFADFPEGYAVWHFALLQQKEALMFLRSFVRHKSKNIAITITDSQNPAIQLQANFVPEAVEIEQIRKIIRSGLPKN